MAEITIDIIDETIVLDTGAQGPQGVDGVGVPPGGTAGQHLAKIDGVDNNTEWVTASGGSGSGDVVGPASATDNAIAVFNGATGKLIKNSTATVSQIAANTAKISYTDSAAVALNTAKVSYPGLEAIQDIVGAMFQGGTHTNASINYDDASGVIDITATGGGGGGGAPLSQEQVEDFVGSLVTQGTGISVNYDDAGNVLTISLTGEVFTTGLLTKLNGIEAGADVSDVAAIALNTAKNTYPSADAAKLSGIEAGADVTDTASVTAAGALMDSEVHANIKTLVLPAGITISPFGGALINDANPVVARTTLGLSSVAVLNETTTAQWRNNTPDRVLTTDQVWASGAEVIFTDAPTIAVNMSAFINATVTLGGNRTLSNPTSEKVGQTGFIRVVQDATGSRTLTFGASYEFAGGTAPVLTTAANAEDVLFYVVLATGRVFISSALDIS